MPIAIFARFLRPLSWATGTPRTLTSIDLIGRQFAVYPDGDLYKIVSKDRTEKKSYGFGVGMETSSFRDGMFCIHDRVKYQRPTDTNEVCMTLLRWSQHDVLALDSKSGKVTQWWVEKYRERRTEYTGSRSCRSDTMFGIQ